MATTKPRSVPKDQLVALYEKARDDGKIHNLHYGDHYPIAVGAPETQTGAFDLPFLEYLAVAARLCQEDMKQTHHESAEMQIWRFVISQFAYGSAAVHKAVAKYLRGGHATTMPTFVLDPSKDPATWPILAESALGKKILETTTGRSRKVIQLHNISLEVYSGRDGWAIPYEGLTDEEHEEWSNQHVPFYLQGLVFLRKCSKRLYALNNRMSPDAGQSHVQLLTKNEQSAILVEKKAFKATKSSENRIPTSSIQKQVG